MYKSILVPTDGSEACDRAAAYAVGIAKLMGSRVVALTVTQPVHVAIPRALMPAHLLASVEAELGRAADAKLAAIERAGTAEGVAVDRVSESGERPWEAIIKVAADRGCDLIVMASHRRTGVSALLIGSETQKVLSHSKVPVLVVR